MTAYASGTCDPLPWKLTSKHKGGISKILISPITQEASWVHGQRKGKWGKEKRKKNNTSGGGGEKRGNVMKSLSLLFFSFSMICDVQDIYPVSDTGMCPCHMWWLLMNTHVLTDKKIGFKILLSLRKAVNDSLGTYILAFCFLNFCLTLTSLRNRRRFTMFNVT